MHFHSSRRTFLAAAAAFAASSGAMASHGRQRPSFLHGVSSDPLQDRAILWTRVIIPNWYDDVDVKWQVACDPKMRKVVALGRRAPTCGAISR